MAIGSVTPSGIPGPGGSMFPQVYEVCTDLTATDNSAATVVNPLTITRTAISQINMINRGLGVGTRLNFCMKYATASWAQNVAPVVQFFGLYLLNTTATYSIQNLYNDSGSAQFTLTTAATDATDSGNGWAFTASFSLDAQNSQIVIPAVKTAGTVSAGSMTGATLQVWVT